MTRVLVTGCRKWKCEALARRVVARLARRYSDLVLIHGAASGVDEAFEEAARIEGVVTEPHPARWRELGNRAGPIRNSAMIDAGADFVIAVHKKLGWSAGTGDAVAKALTRGIPVYLYDDEEQEDPKLITKIPPK